MIESFLANYAHLTEYPRSQSVVKITLVPGAVFQPQQESNIVFNNSTETQTLSNNTDADVFNVTEYIETLIDKEADSNETETRA